jgi:uncharacterized protein (TIGR00730 family)
MRSVAVFCGSQQGHNPLYIQHAKELGALLAQKGIRLIYGGGKAGLMGAVADAALEAGGEVTGIIPRFLNSLERKHDALTETLVTDTMHERKKLLFEKCDAAIIIPGGFGTMDELFELVTWNQLQLHHKKVFVLNTAGFYDTLKQHLDNMYTTGFLYSNPSEDIIFVQTPEALSAHLPASA